MISLYFLGIYIGDGLVIHFTSPSEKSTVSRPSSSLSSAGPHTTCPTNHPRCGSRKSDVTISCLDCFIGKDNLCRYEYGVSKFVSMTIGGGSCSDVQSDPGSAAVQRAIYLFENGFGKYDLVVKNCENFANFCKTGILIEYDDNTVRIPTSSQIRTSPDIFDIIFGKVIKVPVEDMDKFHGRLLRSI